MLTLLITLILGITLGLLLATFLLLYFLKIKCPSCKKLKPVQEITSFNWKQRIITGQPCLKCQRPKPQIDISL